MKRAFLFGIALIFAVSAFGCSAAVKRIEVTTTVTRDEKFNSASTVMTPEEFQQAGFQFGDSCDVEFGNGYTMTDVPFYNGYYVKDYEPVLVAYPGFTYICITYNNHGIWDDAKLTEGEKVTIRLNESGKYKVRQEALGQKYSFDRKDYVSDEQFCNFRSMTGGKLKDNFLFRGTSPVDNSRGRAAYTDTLLKNNEIAYIIDLADNKENILDYFTKEDFNSPYTLELFENGKFSLLDLGSAYRSSEYMTSVVDGMRDLLENSGPAYIHCMEGKDRTGFVCMLLEALAGATYDEMCEDYMKTYENYYAITKEGTPDKYNSIVELYFDSFASFLHGTEDKETLIAADYVQDAQNYLIQGGMTETEIKQLNQMICK